MFNHAAQLRLRWLLFSFLQQTGTSLAVNGYTCYHQLRNLLYFLLDGWSVLQPTPTFPYSFCPAFFFGGVLDGFIVRLILPI